MHKLYITKVNKVKFYILFILILSIIISLLYTVYCWINSSQYLYHFIVITFILISIFVIACILRPILIMYVPSSILSFFIRTPTFLDRNLYFPNHKLLENPSTFKKIKDEVDSAILKTIEEGSFINGPEVINFTNNLIISHSLNSL